MSSEATPARPLLEMQPVARQVDADVTLPGSKSYTNRALILAAMADGRSTITSALFSDDTKYMAECLRRLGVAVREDEHTSTFEVEGQGGRIPASEAHSSSSATPARRPGSSQHFWHLGTATSRSMALSVCVSARLRRFWTRCINSEWTRSPLQATAAHRSEYELTA